MPAASAGVPWQEASLDTSLETASVRSSDGGSACWLLSCICRWAMQAEPGRDANVSEASLPAGHSSLYLRRSFICAS